jgi:polyisoprenoid-binding protein YceI
LTLRGVEKPLVLPFDLTITGDTAKMTGEVTLDRRDFGIGASYEDEGTVGFAVGVKITLTAQRL